MYRVDTIGLEAVRKNNADVIAKEEDLENVTLGGNIKLYEEMVKTAKKPECEEFTLPKYENDNAEEFVMTQLALNWEREGDLAKCSPLLDETMGRMAYSNKAHKKCINLIQILYIRDHVNVNMLE